MALINKMAGQDYIDKTREYLDYLEEHLNNVKRAFCELSEICDGLWWVGDDTMWHTIREGVIHHDLSKFSKEEFIQYREVFFPVEGAGQASMDEAWANHKINNHHHHQTAKTYADIVHMLIDWTAMGYKFGGTVQEYYEKNIDKIKLNEDHIKFMYEIFDKIKESNISK